MKQRVLSCIVLLVITLTCILLSPVSCILFFAAVAILCARELCVNLRSVDIHCADWVLYFYIIAQAGCRILFSSTVVSVVLFVLSVYLCFFAGIVDKRIGGKGAFASVAGLVYPCVLFALLMEIVSANNWLAVFTLACLSTWVCDSFALFGGKRFGKHKLAPEVSPNKTVEGAVCGSLSAVLVGIACYYLLPLYSEPLPLWFCLVVCFVCSVFDQIGDLAESLVKRMLGVKDFSNLIPGHGGMFDRADSLLFSIPCAWLCLYLYHLL